MNDLNIVIMNDNFDPDLCERLFGPLEWDEVIEMATDKLDILDCLVKLEIFPSKSQARKNWKGPIKIEEGFHDFRNLGKMRKRLTIWRPKDVS